MATVAEGAPVGNQPLNIKPLWVMCQKVLPAVYDDSLSYYEAVCKLVSKVNEIIAASDSEDEAIKQLQDEVEKLQQELEDWKNGGFKDFIQEEVMKWVDDNLDFIFTHVVKQVFFGLTEDGYFCAYIPKSWNDIIFDTGAVFSEDTYGRLILRWDVDRVHTVNQTPELAASKPHRSFTDNNGPRYCEK